MEPEADLWVVGTGVGPCCCLFRGFIVLTCSRRIQGRGQSVVPVELKRSREFYEKNTTFGE